jgi:DMSO/TMAO reductase YedYZ molybdopterin-dependent catalytic subunit
MADRFVSRGFTGRRREPDGDRADRIPPGPYVTDDFPVLSAGPTPRIPLDTWAFTIDGLVREPVTLSWAELIGLPSRE